MRFSRHSGLCETGYRERVDVSLFLFTFFLIYIGLHIYAFLKAKAAIGFGLFWGVFLGLFMLIMIFAPFITRFLEKSGSETAARASAYVGYTWLGLIFLFSSYAVMIDIIRLALSSAGLLFGRDISPSAVSPPYLLLLPLVLAVITSVYGYFEARAITTQRVTIRTSKIPGAVGRLRIVQISDVHLGLIVRENRLKRILAIVKEAHPDILVSTGDLVDGEICRLNNLSGLLAEIRPRYGKYAVTGNHEFYAGFKQAKCFTEDAGFTFLRGDAVIPGGLVNIAGVDDPAGKTFGLSKDISEEVLLADLPEDKFTILLKHRPLIDERAAPFFDLQLSGHVHGGQIFPFTIATWLYYPVTSGYVKVSDRAYLYESRGAGTWGPPIRFLAPPEVAVIDLVHEKSPEPTTF
jgi:predicted MPP superfamily phosphohydrolase